MAARREKKRGPIGIQLAGEETGQNRKGRQMGKGQLVAMDVEAWSTWNWRWMRQALALATCNLGTYWHCSLALRKEHSSGVLYLPR